MGFNTAKGKNLFCFLFSDPKVVGHRPTIMGSENKKIFQHFGRSFIPGTLQNVPFSLNELLVNFQQESTVVALADFACSNSKGWPTGPVSIKKSKLG